MNNEAALYRAFENYTEQLRLLSEQVAEDYEQRRLVTKDLARRLRALHENSRSIRSLFMRQGLFFEGQDDWQPNRSLGPEHRGR